MLGQIHFNREITLGYQSTQNRQNSTENCKEYYLVNSPYSSQAEIKNPKVRASKGLQGISSKGKRKLRNAAAILEKKYGKERLTFATVTLPRLPEADREWLHQNWGEFVRQWQQEIKREAARNGEPDLQIVLCSEIQESRLEKYGEFYLHLHAVWCGRPAGNYRYYVTTETARNLTRRIILAIIARRVDKGCYTVAVQQQQRNETCPGQKQDTSRTEIDLVIVDLKPVRKSVERYLGKYLSKGGKLLEKAKEMGFSNSFPKQWWNVTRKLSKVCEDAKQKIKRTLAEFIIDNHEELTKNKLLEYFYLVEIEIEGAMRTVGGVGKLSWAGMKSFGLKQPKIKWAT